MDMSKGPLKTGTKRRTKKGAAHTRRLPPEKPARSACQRANRNRARQKCPIYRPWSGGLQAPGQKRRHKKTPAAPGRIACPAIPNTITT